MSTEYSLLKMKQGQRVTLLSDYKNGHGFEYKAGQTGTVVFAGESSDMVSVDLDGYEASRQSAHEFREKYGETLNIVEFYASFPVAVLRIQQ